MTNQFKQLRRKSVRLLTLATLLAAIVVGVAPSQAMASITYNEFVSASSGKCLDTPGADTSNGVWLGQWTCFNALGQNWRLESTGTGFFKIVSALDRKCVDVYNYAQQNGAAVVTWDCIAGASNQEWSIPAGGNNGNGIMLRARHSGKCLDLYAFSQQDGPNQVVQWDCDWLLNQFWSIRL
jgi:Ricin-type beta-trefoil lectin domain